MFYVHLRQRGEDSGEQNETPKRTNNQQPPRSTQRPWLHNINSNCGFIWTPQACSHALKLKNKTTFHLRKVGPLRHDKQQQQDGTEYKDRSRIGPNHKIHFHVVAFVTNNKKIKKTQNSKWSIKFRVAPKWTRTGWNGRLLPCNMMTAGLCLERNSHRFSQIKKKNTKKQNKVC